MLFEASPSSARPLMRLESSVIETSLPMPLPMLVTVARSLKRSPVRTTEGTVNVTLK